MSETPKDPPVPQAADITQQATTPTPPKKLATEKNRKRVAAAKLTAQKSKLARTRGAKTKAAEEAAATIASNKAAEPAPDHPNGVQPAPEKPFASSLPTTQGLLSVAWLFHLLGFITNEKR